MLDFAACIAYQNAQDNDIMWIWDAFLQFFPNVDIQFSCDYFIGDPYAVNIFPNTGLFYVKSNDRTVLFYKFWSPEIRIQKNRKQDVLNEINLISLLLRLDWKWGFLIHYTLVVSVNQKGFNQVCTMHADCCIGLEKKVNDHKILLQVWRKYMSSPRNLNGTAHAPWTVPDNLRYILLITYDSFISFLSMQLFVSFLFN